MTDYRFQVLDAGNARDLEVWTELWTAWPEREVFTHPGYVRLYEDVDNKAMCASLASREGNVLYPFLLRKIDRKLYGGAEGDSFFDVGTPYGYGGPAAWGSQDLKKLAGIFWNEFDQWARARHIISEFIRFGLWEGCMLPYPGQREMKFNNIVRNVEMAPEMIWDEMDHTVRSNIRKARKAGVTVVTDPSGSMLDEFLRIYYGTMNRLDAADEYYFPRSYFEGIHKNLPGMFIYFYSVIDGKIVSCGLNLCSETNAYAFLGGTDKAFLKQQPNSLLQFEEFSWAHDMGKRSVVLGGGHGSDDGVYRFKRSFAPGGIIPFYCGSRVLLPEAYAGLVEGRKMLLRMREISWEPRPGFFPAYRT